MRNFEPGFNSYSKKKTWQGKKMVIITPRLNK